jgi:hypothetical protein
MRDQKRFWVSVFSTTVVLFLAVGVGLRAPAISAQATQQPIPATTQDPIPYIPATAAFSDSPVCDAVDLSNNDDESRGRPEWKTIIIDPTLSLLSNPPTILEGFVAIPPTGESSGDQAPAEVAEEDIPWNHYTHDFTVRVAPDMKYQHLLSSWVNTDGTVGVHTEMEVEWDSASLMEDGEGFQRTWGAVPEFVWPAVHDRIWVSGRWIFDCGHPSSSDVAHVQFSTEIHPPRALVTFRLNHPALDSFPVPRTSAPNFSFPQSYLPVTGCPVGSLCGPATLLQGVPNSGPTNVPVTEADIFVSGNGGGANDLCQLTHNSGDDCGTPHTSPIIPVNDRNYVFDIYPPGTNYSLANGGHLVNGTFPVTPPVPDASLQWRTVDHSSELPAHACGGTDNSVCHTVDPIFCLLDASTPSPDQTETGCPAVPARPTRLRVILPFCGTNLQSCVGDANFFAQSILLGWDDVPRGNPQNSSPTNMSANLVGGVALQATPVVRNFKVTLHAFTVNQNGENCFNPITCPGDWRVFVGVAGQWRYISPLFETDDGSIALFSDAENICNGKALTENGDGDCFVFDNTPWKVSVQDGTPIHISVGGWESDRIDSHFCRNYNDPNPVPAGCAPFSFGDVFALATANNDRIGTYEFDLQPPAYAWSDAPSFTTAQAACHHNLIDLNSINPITCDELNYKVEFSVQEIPAATAPVSAALGIGTPQFGQFVTSATPLTLSSTDAEGFQYRSYLQGGPLPTYATLPFPVHWTHADLPAGSQSVPVFLTGADGPSLLQYSAESFGQLLEPRHTATLTLDNTPPVINIAQPQATPAYPHCGVLTLSYTVDDGTGSGVASFTPTMDGATTLMGVLNLLSGQRINLLTELILGTHTFAVNAVDNVGNAGSTSVTFTIIVTPDSIKCDVNQFLQSGAITNHGIANSLLAKLNDAAAARARGQCSTASNIYRAFINELQAQSGKHVDAAAAAIMIADAQYLIAHCP